MEGTAKEWRRKGGRRYTYERHEGKEGRKGLRNENTDFLGDDTYAFGERW
jgi:hypothetical protein